MSKISIEIQFFGAFRPLGESMNMEIEKGLSLSAFKECFINQVGSDYALLIKESAIANNEEVLDETYLLESDMQLSILPPVCGG
tara:strand:- start:317 stop:568 length:252 start_codon:yes stop_codon:yes gene_type:complete